MLLVVFLYEKIFQKINNTYDHRAPHEILDFGIKKWR